jgi:tryptophanyl-tRNA synthetase
MITGATQRFYTTAIAAISANSKAQSGNILPGFSDNPVATTENSTTVNISQAARNLLASTQLSNNSRTYNFTNMTSSQMQGATQDLFKSGKIDFTQLFMLQNAGVPIGRQGAHGEFIELSAAEKASFSHTPMNYVQLSKGAISVLEKTGYATDPKSGYEQWKGILTTLQNMTFDSPA